MSRWYTRKQYMPNVPSTDPNSICYCRQLSDELALDCSNHICVIKKFHFSCLRMSDPIPKTRYCPSCHLLKVYVFLARKQIWQTIFLSVTTVTVKMVISFIFVAWITKGFLTTIEPHGCAGTVKLVEHTNQQSRVLHKPLSKQKRPQLPPVLLLTYLHHSHLVKQTLPQKHLKWWLQWWWSLNNRSHSRIHGQKGTFR